MIDHHSYCHTYAVAALHWAREIAKQDRLESVVTTMYWEHLRQSFNSNDYPVGRNGYIQLAGDILYDLGI